MGTRRKILSGLLSAFGLGASGAWAIDNERLSANRNGMLRFLLTRFDNSDLDISAAPTIDDAVCVLTQEQTEGPYHISSPVRSDVTEGKPGLPLELAMQVVSADGCTPMAGVTVEIWHTDAAGRYSGHPDYSRDVFRTLEYLEWDAHHMDPVLPERWLRGAQTTDNNGVVRFKTIFPGWYEMRTPHIHFKIGGPDGELFTSQFYFSDQVANRVYTTHPDYVAFGPSPYRPENDLVVDRSQGAKNLVLNVVTDDRQAQASAKIGIALKTA